MSRTTGAEFQARLGRAAFNRSGVLLFRDALDGLLGAAELFGVICDPCSAMVGVYIRPNWQKRGESPPDDLIVTFPDPQQRRAPTYVGYKFAGQKRHYLSIINNSFRGGDVIDNTQDTPMIEADDAIDAEMEEVADD